MDYPVVEAIWAEAPLDENGNGRYWQVKRTKTSVAADLPILSELAEELASLPKDRMLFIIQDAKLIS